MIKLSRDINGNKTLKYSNGVDRGFSVQTLGNLPKTHQMINGELKEYTAMIELYDHVKSYGTSKQKHQLGFNHGKRTNRS